MKKIAFTLTLIFAIAIGFAQTNAKETIFHFTKGQNGKVMQVQPNGQKTCSFQVSGLNPQSSVDKLVNKAKSKKGVMEFNISNQEVNGMRAGNIIVYADAKIAFLKELLLENGINTITIDGVKKNTRELAPKKK
jgi:hypothetical protein